MRTLQGLDGSGSGRQLATNCSRQPQISPSATETLLLKVGQFSPSEAFRTVRCHVHASEVLGLGAYVGPLLMLRVSLKPTCPSKERCHRRRGLSNRYLVPSLFYRIWSATPRPASPWPFYSLHTMKPCALAWGKDGCLYIFFSSLTDVL